MFYITIVSMFVLSAINIVLITAIVKLSDLLKSSDISMKIIDQKIYRLQQTLDAAIRKEKMKGKE